MKPFMKVVFAYVNATARVRDMLGRGDLEDDDVEQLIADSLNCIFQSCTEGHDGRDGSGEELSVPYGVAMFSRDNEVVDIIPRL